MRDPERKEHVSQDEWWGLQHSVGASGILRKIIYWTDWILLDFPWLSPTVIFHLKISLIEHREVKRCNISISSSSAFHIFIYLQLISIINIY